MSDIDLSAASDNGDNSGQWNADTVVILSSELISKITEQYFNKVMFKQRVSIVDLKPTPDGYMFSIAFVEKEEGEAHSTKVDTRDQMTWNGPFTEGNSVTRPTLATNSKVTRNSQGKFTKVTS